MRISVPLVSGLLLVNVPAYAQGTRVVDEGSFTISTNGRTVGRENFRISATTRGDITEYVASAVITYGDRRIAPELHTTAEGTVVSYEVTTRSGGTSESWRGAVAGSRLNTRIERGRSTAAREYIVPTGTLVLDDEIMHHNWFLALRSHSGDMPVVVPRRTDVKANVTMTTVGEETLQIGNHDLVAVHLRAAVAGGEARDIWVDKSGRLLKVAMSGRGLVAIRDDPPRA